MVKRVGIFAALMVVVVLRLCCGTGTGDVTYERQILPGKKLEAVGPKSHPKLVCGSHDCLDDEGDDAETGNTRGGYFNKKRQQISNYNELEEWDAEIGNTRGGYFNEKRQQVSNYNDMDIDKDTDPGDSDDSKWTNMEQQQISNNNNDMDIDDMDITTSEDPQNINDVNRSSAERLLLE